MKQRKVIAHLREAVADEVDSLRANSDSILEASRWLPVRETVEGLVERDPANMYIGGTHPRPSLGLLGQIYNSLPTKRPPSKRVGQFVSGVLLPLAEIEPEESSQKATTNARRYTGACGVAESNFQAALTQINTGRRPTQRYLTQSLIGIYHNSDGVPVMLRKKSAESTALTLAPLSIGKVVLPRGAIVAVNPDVNGCATGTVNRQRFAISTFEVPEKIPLHPLRLSAWAYDHPLDRAAFAAHGRLGWEDKREFFYDEELAKMLERTSLDDFVTASQKIVELCAS